ncbi:hypothetical protein D3C76_1423400 [compost metagenome]
MRHHLQHGAAGVENQRVAVVDKPDGGIGDLAFLFGIDMGFAVDRLIAIVAAEHHAAISADHFTFLFQQGEILADGGAGGGKVRCQGIHCRFAMPLQIFKDSGLPLLWFHSPSCSQELRISLRLTIQYER